MQKHKTHIGLDLETILDKPRSDKRKPSYEELKKANRNKIIKTNRSLAVKPSAASMRKESTSAMNEKWSQEVAKEGWVGIPTLILDYQVRLGLKPQHLNALLQLLKRWWVKDTLPYESVSQMAKTMDITTRRFRQLISELEKMQLNEIKAEFIEDDYPGYVTRYAMFYKDKPEQTSNAYGFEGLIMALQFLKKEKDEMVEDSQKRKPSYKKIKRPSSAI